MVDNFLQISFAKLIQTFHHSYFACLWSVIWKPKVNNHEPSIFGSNRHLNCYIVYFIKWFSSLLDLQPTEPTKATENPNNKDDRAQIESLLTSTEQFNSPNIQNGEGLGELSEFSKAASAKSPVPPFKSSELQDQKYLDEISGSSKTASAENPATPFKSSEMPTRDGLTELSESSKTEPEQKLMECPQPPILDRKLLVTDAFEHPRESSKTKTSIPSNFALPQMELVDIFEAGPKQSPKQNSKIPKESPQSRTDRKRRVNVATLKFHFFIFWAFLINAANFVLQISSSPSDRKEKRLRAEDIFKNRETEDMTFNIGELRLRLEGVTERRWVFFSLLFAIIARILSFVFKCFAKDLTQNPLVSSESSKYEHEKNALYLPCGCSLSEFKKVNLSVLSLLQFFGTNCGWSEFL